MPSEATVSPADRVDIALATYNGATYLPAFLETVAAQDHPNCRIVASDDHSSDRTIDLLEAFAPDHTIVVQNKGPRGFRSNFANAIAHCDAPYIALADQDDAWARDKISALLSRMTALEARHGADTPLLVCSDLAVVDRDLQPLRPSFFASWDPPVASLSFADLTLGNRIPGCSMLLNRALVDRAMPLPTSIHLHDWWLVLVAAALGVIDVVDRPLVLYRQHGGNQLGDVPKRVAGWDRILPKLKGPVAHLSKRAELFRGSMPDVMATLQSFDARFGADLDSARGAVLRAGVTPGLVRKLWRYRSAHSPFGRVFKIMALFFLDETERRAGSSSRSAHR